MVNSMTVLVILLVTMTVVTCQTFQYSRGWTTGKRADAGGFGVGLPSEFKMNFPVQEAIQPNDPDTIHCGLRKLRMLLRGNTNDQLYHLPCELLNILPKIGKAEANRNNHRDFYDNSDNNN